MEGYYPVRRIMRGNEGKEGALMKMSKEMYCVQGNNENINENPKIFAASAICLLVTIQGSIGHY